ncbi:MAG TPA: hypothetical protein VK836_22070 [Streptosporangiaceae bacterium]|nr:hypothetical protein [Streptosporangiaceae bacterium]
MLRDCVGADSDSEDAGRTPVAAGRLAAGRLLDLRDAGRDFGAADRGRELVALGLAVVALGVAEFCDCAPSRVEPGMSGMAALARAVVPAALVVLVEAARRVDVPRADEARVDDPRADEARVDEARADEARVDEPRVDEPRVDEVPVEVLLADVLLDDGRVDVLLAAGLRALVVREVVARRAGLAAATGLADDIVLAAAVSAFAAVIMAFVAVFIDLMAVDIVCADDDALVAAAVILVAAEVTLVAAEDTVLAAVAGVAELRLAVLRPAALERDPVEREAVDRDAVVRVDREAVLRVARAAVPLAGFAALLRAVLDVALDVLELELDGRLAAPLDALRPTDLLRAVLAELRRVAARVVD